MADLELNLSREEALQIAEIIRRIAKGTQEKEQKRITSFEFAGLFNYPHTLVYNRITRYIAMEATEEEKEHFEAAEREYRGGRTHPIWNMTEDGCKLYLDQMNPEMKNSKYYGEGIRKLNRMIQDRFHPKADIKNILMDGKSRNECSYIKELFDVFITGPAIENREIKELGDKYEEFYKVLRNVKISGKDRSAVENSVMGIAIEAEMQGFLYGFKLFEIMAEKALEAA